MRNALEGFDGSVKIGGKTVTNLRYADAIVLFSGSMKELETLVTNVNLASEQAGVKLKIQKTNVIKMTGDQENVEMRDLVINGESIETVENFIYLGANIKNDCNASKDIRKLTIARNAVISFNNVWKDRSIGIKTKIRILNTSVFTIASYGCECWAIKNLMKKTEPV